MGAAQAIALAEFFVMTMSMNLFYFRPGEEARMQARCQFVLTKGGKCGAMLTYPIKGYPWRRNIIKNYEFSLSENTQELMFSEVYRILDEYPEECLNNDQLWSDSSEKANVIIRDNETGKLCYSIGTYQDNCDWEQYFSIRENSEALINSELYKTVSKIIAPYEKL